MIEVPILFTIPLSAENIINKPTMYRENTTVKKILTVLLNFLYFHIRKKPRGHIKSSINTTKTELHQNGIFSIPHLLHFLLILCIPS